MLPDFPRIKERLLRLAFIGYRRRINADGLIGQIAAMPYFEGEQFASGDVEWHIEESPAEVKAISYEIQRSAIIDRGPAALVESLENAAQIHLKELHELLARSKVYVQASYTEGFGLALAEAMASGCVPVVTRRGAIPEIVGNAGFYAEYGDEAAFAKRIREALRSETGTDARRRVERLFSVERRSQELRRVIAQLGDRHTRLSCLKRGSATAVHEGVNR